MAVRQLKEWIDRGQVEPTHHAVAARVCEPYLAEARFRNDAVWSNPRNWRFGFYFGKDDSRLWVPRRDRNGKPRDGQRVVNFGHPIGRKSFPILMLAYFTGLLGAITLIAIALGARW
jgi:hypothetical protein